METIRELELKLTGLSRAEAEGLALESCQTGNVSDEQLRRLLGLKTQFEVHAFLKQHGVYLNYSREDLERDLEFGDSWLSSQTPHH